MKKIYIVLIGLFLLCYFSFDSHGATDFNVEIGREYILTFEEGQYSQRVTFEPSRDQKIQLDISADCKFTVKGNFNIGTVYDEVKEGSDSGRFRGFSSYPYYFYIDGIPNSTYTFKLTDVSQYITSFNIPDCIRIKQKDHGGDYAGLSYIPIPVTPAIPDYIDIHIESDNENIVRALDYSFFNGLYSPAYDKKLSDITLCGNTIGETYITITDKVSSVSKRVLVIVEDSNTYISKFNSLPDTITLYAYDKNRYSKNIDLYCSPENVTSYDITVFSDNDNIADISYYNNESYCVYNDTIGDVWISAFRPGKTYVTVKDKKTGVQKRILVTVLNGAPDSSVFMPEKNLTMHRDDWKELKVVTTGEGEVEWKSSNPKVLALDDFGETCIIDAKKCGTATVTATYTSSFNGWVYSEKSVSCKVKVNPYKKLYYYGEILDYDTRNNEFQVRFENYSEKKIIIDTNGGTAINDDYKSFDRSLYKRKISLKPNQKRTIWIKAKGSSTWYDYKDFSIIFKIKYKSKIYKAWAYPED